MKMIHVYRFTTGLLMVFVLLPIAWLFYAAFLPPEAVMQASLATFGFSLQNFRELLGTGVWRAMGVSFLASGLAVGGQLAFGLCAAYAIRAGLRILGLVMVLLALPSELLMVPLYRLLQNLGMLDRLPALFVPFLASPLVIFLLLQSLRRLPWELVEAARLDGASESTIVARIVAPVMRPELIATAVLAFAAHWNLVLYPRVMAGEPRLYTVQVFLVELLRTRPLDWGILGAAALVTTLPIFILYIIFEERIIRVFEGGFRG